MWHDLSIFFNEIVLSNKFLRTPTLFRRWLLTYICIPWNCWVCTYCIVALLTGFANDVLHYWNYWRQLIGHFNVIQYLKSSVLGYGWRASHPGVGWGGGGGVGVGGGGWGWGVGVGGGWGWGGGGGGVGGVGGGGGGTRVHHGRVGSAGLCDLKILHPWRRLKKGSKFYNDPPPPTLEKGVNILHQYEKSAKKGGQKSTILKNIGVKILQVWKWRSKFYMLKNRGQNSTMLEKRGVNILHPTPKVEVKILHRLKKGVKRAEPTRYPKGPSLPVTQKGRAYPLPKI